MSCNKQSSTISAVQPIINPKINNSVFVVVYPCLMLWRIESRKVSCMEYLVLWGKYHYTWHPVVIHEHRKENTGWAVTATFLSVYCLLHVSALVKINIRQIKMYIKKGNLNTIHQNDPFSGSWPLSFTKFQLYKSNQIKVQTVH